MVFGIPALRQSPGSIQLVSLKLQAVPWAHAPLVEAGEGNGLRSLVRETGRAWIHQPDEERGDVRWNRMVQEGRKH